MQRLNRPANFVNFYRRCYSTNLKHSASKSKHETSTEIRQKFLDFFLNENKHSFIRSSPVVPFCDPTVAFVNAGMNQFKGVFLGTHTAQHRKVANSQKCVRVGGKHNDLSIVGTDGYHHTFFEMLGNWSFGDYFKKEACEMSWKLLTDVYGIESSNLYVTYFQGDPKLGLDADYECRDIWRNIGVPENRILPFGASENFWEMGLTGPCGPCTEIHIDRTGSQNRAADVNRGLEDLTELWNIVFIQYNRLEDNSIHHLPNFHIDTGMGFERLTAVLQNKMSNYDTDIFQPLFASINKECKGIPKYDGNFGKLDVNNLDTSYRILADHSRMITACLADGMIPEQNQKLRRIIRRALTICDKNFKSKNLLHELSYQVADMFKDCYPEMGKNLYQVQQIIKYEQELLDSLRTKSTLEWEQIVSLEPKLGELDVIAMPGLIGACKEIKALKNIDGETAFKLYDTHGLDEQSLQELAQAFDLPFDYDAFKDKLHEAKTKSKAAISFLENFSNVRRHLRAKNVAPTDDSFKYAYRYANDAYDIPNLDVRVALIVRDDKVVASVAPNVRCSLLLDRTNMYCESGGQCSDKGSIRFADGTAFEIENVFRADGHLFHEGRFFASEASGAAAALAVGSAACASGSLAVDGAARANAMNNHTATHLLNAAIKRVSLSTVCQKSSQVRADSLTFDVSIFGDKLTLPDVEAIERLVKSWIDAAADVKTTVIDSQQLLQLNNVTLVPGEIYPDNGIRIVEMHLKNLYSREACCGTHVLNTSHIEDFSVILTHSLGRSTISIEAVTGKRATVAKEYGKQMLETINILKKNIDDNIDNPEELDKTVTNLKRQLQYSIDDSNIMPLVIKQQCLEALNVISKKIKESARQTLRGFIEMEMKNAFQNNIKTTKNNQSYIVHYLRSSTILESVSLQKVTNLCPNLPILVVSYTDGIVKARCCVPKELVSSTFNAEIWLRSTVAAVFNSAAAPPKGQSAEFVCNMKGKKINLIDLQLLITKAINEAENFVENTV